MESTDCQHRNDLSFQSTLYSVASATYPCWDTNKGALSKTRAPELLHCDPGRKSTITFWCNLESNTKHVTYRGDVQYMVVSLVIFCGLFKVKANAEFQQQNTNR